MPPEATEAAPVAAPSEEAERAALIAELDAEDSAPEESAEEVAGEAEPGEEPTEEEGDDEADEEVDEEPLQSADDLREHLKSLLESGDVRKVEEALGLEKGALKTNGAKLRYVRQSLQKAERITAEAQQATASAEQLRDAARQVYGPMVEAKQLFHNGTPQGVQQAARFVERHFGVPLTQFVEAVVKAGRGEASERRGPDPEVAELKQTVQRLLEEKNQQSQQAQAQAAQQRHLEAIKGKLGGTPLAKLPDGARVVYDKLVGSYDKSLNGYRMTLADAIAAAKEDPAVKWKLHEMGLKAAKKPAPAAPVATRKRVVVAQSAKSPAEKEAAEKAALIAELEADERKSERAARRSNARR